MDFKTKIAYEELHGLGVEFGALHKRLPVDPSKTTMMYADRLNRAQALDLFPELQELSGDFVEPDIILDLDVGDYRDLAHYQFDFFVANHFIEHLVNPIHFLRSVSSIIKPGSVLFLTVPDKEHTFDHRRALTTNKHLWREYKRGERRLSNGHIREFLRFKAPVTEIHPAIVRYFQQHNLPLSYYRGNKLPLNPVKRRRLYQFHRKRSIHVHVWNRESFDRFIRWVDDELALGLSIRLVDGPGRSSGGDDLPFAKALMEVGG